jgi:hypothetical protein
MHPHGAVALWVAAMVLAFSVYAAQSPVAAFLSAAFPAPCDLMKLRAGNMHPLAGIVGMFASLFASALGVGVFAATYALTGSPATVLVAALSTLAIVGALAIAGLKVAADMLEARRENLAMIAQGR